MNYYTYYLFKNAITVGCFLWEISETCIIINGYLKPCEICKWSSCFCLKTFNRILPVYDIHHVVSNLFYVQLYAFLSQVILIQEHFVNRSAGLCFVIRRNGCFCFRVSPGVCRGVWFDRWWADETLSGDGGWHILCV